MGEQTASKSGSKPEPKILFQQYFKSGGRARRTYAAQVKQTAKGDHFLVLTEGRRLDDSDEVKKSWLMVFSEDFPEFFRLLHETAQFIKAHPVPPEVKQRRQRYAAKMNGERPGAGANHDAAKPRLERQDRQDTKGAKNTALARGR